MAYLLDANVFIQAKNLYYGMDFCPAFWDWLVKQNEVEQVFSIEKVADRAVSEFMSQKLESITLHGILLEGWGNGGSP